MDARKIITKDIILKDIEENEGSAEGLSYKDVIITGDFQKLCLVGINFFGSRLEECYFNLPETRLIRANLQKTRCGRSEDKISNNFSGAQMCNAKFNGADLSYVDFTNTNLSSARFDPLIQQKSPLPTNLTSANLYKATLRNADMKGAILARANLQGADLTDALLEGANLSKTNLSGAIFANTRFDKDSLDETILQEENDELYEAKLIYLALKRNFQEIGDSDSASWAYIRSREMERMMCAPRKVRKYYGDKFFPPDVENRNQKPLHVVKFHIKFFIRWIGIWVAKFLGYGERPGNAFWLALFFITLFTFLFLIFGGLEAETGHQIGFWDYTLYSVGAFVTLNTMTPVTRTAQFLTSLEALSGIVTLAAFTSAIGQRIGSR